MTLCIDMAGGLFAYHSDVWLNDGAKIWQENGFTTKGVNYFKSYQFSFFVKDLDFIANFNESIRLIV